MRKIIKKLNIFKKGPVPYGAEGSRSGFVLLFAVTISAILLAIALGVANIALKEVKFGTSARDTNDAFFAADTGIEYTLFKDKTSANYPAPGSWPAETIGGLGSGSQGCVIVTITKTTSPSVTNSFVSKGYNNGSGGNGSVGAPWTCVPTTNSVERELDVSYGGSFATVQNVTWQNAVGVTVSGSNLTKTATDGWGNAGASSSSAQSIPSGDGYVEFSTNENNHGKMGGLSNGNPAQDYTKINFAMNINSAGSINIYESGILKATGISTYIAGDVLRIAVVSGVVNYYKNGTLLYTSSIMPVYPLLFGTALNQSGGTITNAKISF